MGASVVGYAFGRADLSSLTVTEPNERNKRTHEDFFEAERGETQEQGSNGRMNSSIPPASGSQTLPVRSPTSSRRLQRSMLSMKRARRKSVGNFSSSLDTMFDDRVEGQRTTAQAPPRSNTDESFSSRPFYPLRKRLSALSYSHESSLASTSRPGSPSISFSNGSAAFSYAESATPIFGDVTVAPRIPNKLVKRAPLERASDGPFLNIGVSKRPTIRRPATSHQRSADYVRRSCHTSVSFSEDNHTRIGYVEPIQSAKPQWRQYFGVKVSHDSEAMRKRGLVVDTDGIRRIVPDPKRKPVLVIARNIIPASFEVDDTLSQDHGSSFHESRSNTPPIEPATNITSSTSQGPELNSDTRAKRSFSFGDLLNTSQIARRATLSSKSQVNRLSRRRNSRIVSAPLFSPNHDPNTLSATEEEATKYKEPHPTELKDDQLIAPARAAASEITGSTNVFHETPSNTLAPDAESFKSNAVLRDLSQRLSFQVADPGSTKVVAQPPETHQTIMRSSSQSKDSRMFHPSLQGNDESLQVRRAGNNEQDHLGQDMLNISRTRGSKNPFVVQSQRLGSIFDSSPNKSARDSGEADGPSLKKHRARFISASDRSSQLDVVPGLGSKDNAAKSEVMASGNPLEGSESYRWPSKRQQQHSSSQATTAQHSFSFSSDTPHINMDADESRWSFCDEEEPGSWLLPASDTSTAPSPHTKSDTQARSGGKFIFASAKSGDGDHADKDTRTSIFDWSEQPSETNTTFRTPPRPKTVHGKKDADGKVNRVAGRRAPSGLHARSQSVPAVPDVAGKRDAVVRNKFGTWGVGTKGVTEDWNDDFDFPEFSDNMESSESCESRVDSGFSMFVPKNIQEQQNNVLANIGLLREWGILIEELKTLRSYAGSLGLLEDASNSLWSEVDAMIDLADQEATDESTWPRASSPPSPGVDIYAFDDPPSLPSRNTRPRRKSVLPSEDDIFKVNHMASRADQDTVMIDSTGSNQPRKDSEAVAISVIEALQKRKSSSDPSLQSQTVQPSKKVPFDTATLRHIVPYVSGLLRKVKDVLRDAEKLYNSPRQGSRFEEAFTARLYPDPIEESPTSRKSRRRESNSPSTSEQQTQGNESELTPRMKMMKVM